MVNISLRERTNCFGVRSITLAMGALIKKFFTYSMPKDLDSAELLAQTQLTNKDMAFL